MAFFEYGPLIWAFVTIVSFYDATGVFTKYKNNDSLSKNGSETISKLTARPYTYHNQQIEMITDFFEIPQRNQSNKSQTAINRKNSNNLLITKTKCRNCYSKSTSTFFGKNWTLLRNEAWSLPAIVFAILVMFLIGCFEIFVVCKAWTTTPSRRHLFLGQMLLLGLFLCAGLGAILAIQPSLVTCALIRFGVGVSYALVFASLLVKCIFLISLNSGVYLPAPYQALLLFFSVLIQFAIAIQWLVHSPPLIDTFNIDEMVSSHHQLLVTVEHTDTIYPSTITLCRASFAEILFSLIYVVFLIIFVAFLAIKSRHIRDNYREAIYICLSVLITIFIWFSWIVIGLMINERHKDACLAFGLIFTSVFIFLFMFMPKGRQLAAMGKDGIYLEDRDDRFSASSRAGSGYSPSFFHFKPVSYDVINDSQNHKHHPPTVAALGPDRLVSYPAPPTCKKFFQYYPNSIAQCYYPPRFSSGLFLRPDDGNFYTSLEPTLSTNPNVYFQPRKGFHPGMIY